MKSFLKKDKANGSLILGLFGVVFFLLLALFSKQTLSEDSLTLFALSRSQVYSEQEASVFALVLKILFFASLVPLLFSGYSLFKRNCAGFFVAFFYDIVLLSGLIAFQVFFSFLTSGSIALIIISFILLLAALALLFFRKKLLKGEEEPSTDSKETKNASVLSMVLFFADLLVFLSFFFVPLYNYKVETGETWFCIRDVLASGTHEIMDLILFFVFFAFLLFAIFYLIRSLSDFFQDRTLFLEKTETMTVVTVIAAVAFLLSGFIISFTKSLAGVSSYTIAYVPLLLAGTLATANSFIKGSQAKKEEAVSLKKKEKKGNFEPLLFVTLLTVITFLSLFLNVIVVTLTYGDTSKTFGITGIKLLSDFPSLGSGYQIIAFYLVVMMISSGLAFLWTIAAFLSRHPSYKKIAKTASYLNVSLLFFLAISGLYFSIAREINKGYLEQILEYYQLTDVSLDSCSYSMRSDAIYPFAGECLLVMMMILRHTCEEDNAKETEPVKEEAKKENPFVPEAEKNSLLSGLPLGEKDEEEEEEPKEKKESKGKSAEPEKEAAVAANPEEEKEKDFNPCPAFTLIDSKMNSYKADLERRMAKQASYPSLPGLMKFVVDYAKNSRLHLSYSEQTMASFIAGFGTARLSILQGMSGTGKTSLPKIFMEAISGDCDIVEVESSWKDKNELLGYYNEFSLMYTPRKFTQFLYKASLNPDIPTFLVLDEMNLSRIEYYFSDFLSLMENEEGKRELRLLNVPLYETKDGERVPYRSLKEGSILPIPQNVFFIGTANRDESTFVISDKVYDRAVTMNFEKRAPKVRNYSSPIPSSFYSYSTIHKLFQDALLKGTFDVEKEQVIGKVEALLSPFNISFGNRILNQMESFVALYEACFPDQDVRREAVETILLSKVVSKLEVKTIDDKDALAASFRNLGLKRCAEFIDRLSED